MNSEETPLRRTARARKINSRFDGDDIDEGYRKLVGRIAASSSGNTVEKSPQITNLNSKDADANLDQTATTTVTSNKRVENDAAESKLPKTFKKKNNKGAKLEETVDEKKFDSKIIRWRSSTESDSEESRDCFSGNAESKNKVDEASRLNTSKPVVNLQDVLGDAITSFAGKDTSESLPATSNKNYLKGVKGKIVLKSVVLKKKSCRSDGPNKMKSSLPAAGKEDTPCPFSSDGEGDIPLTKLIKNIDKSPHKKKKFKNNDSFNKLLKSDSHTKDINSAKTFSKNDAVKSKKKLIASDKLKACNVLFKKNISISNKKKLDQILQAKKNKPTKGSLNKNKLKGGNTSSNKLKAQHIINKKKPKNFIAPTKTKKLLKRNESKKSANLVPGSHLVTLSSLVLEIPLKPDKSIPAVKNKNIILEKNKEKIQIQSNSQKLDKDKPIKVKDSSKLHPVQKTKNEKEQNKKVSNKRTSDSHIEGPPSKTIKLDEKQRVEVKEKSNKSPPATTGLYVVESNSISYVVEANLAQDKQKGDKVTNTVIKPNLTPPTRVPLGCPKSKSTEDETNLEKVKKPVSKVKKDIANEHITLTPVAEKILGLQKQEIIKQNRKLPPTGDASIKNRVEQEHKSDKGMSNISECESRLQMSEARNEAPAENKLAKENLTLNADALPVVVEPITCEAKKKADIFSPKSLSKQSKPSKDEKEISTIGPGTSKEIIPKPKIDSNTDDSKALIAKHQNVNKCIEPTNTKSEIVTHKFESCEIKHCSPILQGDQSKEKTELKQLLPEIEKPNVLSESNESKISEVSQKEKPNNEIEHQSHDEKNDNVKHNSDDKVKNVHHTDGQKQNHDLHKPTEDVHKSRDDLHKPKEDLHKPKEDMHKSRDGLHKPKEDMHKSIDDLHKSKEDFHKSRNDVHISRDAVHKSRDDMYKSRGDLRKSRDDLHKSRGDLYKSRDGLHDRHHSYSSRSYESDRRNSDYRHSKSHHYHSRSRHDYKYRDRSPERRDRRHSRYDTNEARSSKSYKRTDDIPTVAKGSEISATLDKQKAICTNKQSVDNIHSVVANITTATNDPVAIMTKEADKFVDTGSVAKNTMETPVCVGNVAPKSEGLIQQKSIDEPKFPVAESISERQSIVKGSKQMVESVTPNCNEVSNILAMETNIIKENSSTDLKENSFMSSLNNETTTLGMHTQPLTSVVTSAEISTDAKTILKEELSITRQISSSRVKSDEKCLEADLYNIKMPDESKSKLLDIQDFFIKEEDKFDISLWPKSLDETMSTLDIPLPQAKPPLVTLPLKEEAKSVGHTAGTEDNLFSPILTSAALKTPLPPPDKSDPCNDFLNDSTLMDADEKPSIKMDLSDSLKCTNSEDSLKEIISAEEKERKNKEVVKQRLKSFIHLNENMYLNEKTRTRSKEVRRMVCDCSLSKEELKNGDKGCGDDCLNRLLMIECGSRCSLRDNCTNKQFQEKLYSKVDVFNADEKGCGICASVDILAGTFVMEYIGEVFGAKEFKRRRKEYAKESNAHFYFMALRADNVIDATRKGNISRFINHSCDPNAETQKWTVNGELRIGFFSTKFIAAGEEINFDYRLERYGQEPQKCYCGTAICRGWLGESPDEKTKEEIEEDKKKLLRDKKRKEEKRALLNSIDVEDEIEKLSLRGLRNRQDTLDLSRLMVRAEDCSSRLALLQLLNDSEKACKRLFLDYHGLKLLWSWMVDLGTSGNYYTIKLQVLQTLGLLPITNRTQLTDSKVLSIVQRWSKQVHSSPQRASLSPEEARPSDEENSATMKSSSEIVDKSTPDSENQSSTPEDSSLDSESSTKKESDKSGFNFLSNLLKEASRGLKSSGGNSEMNTKDGIKELKETTDASKKTEDIVSTSEKTKDSVAAMAEKLLNDWSTLSEAFRIPKKERIQIMKEHEREVEKGFREYLDRERSDKRSSYGNWARRDKEERRRKRRSRETERKRKEIYEDSGLTKEERRERFAQQAAKEEEEIRCRKSLQESVWHLHVQRCAMLSSNPSFTPIFDGSGHFYWDPYIGNWQPFAGQCENLPVPALYGAICGEDQSSPSLFPESLFVSGVSPEYMDTFVKGIPLPGELTPSHFSPSELRAATPPLIPPHQLNVLVPSNWKIARTADGNIYFYHTKTRTSQWIVPTNERHFELLKQFGIAVDADFGSDSSSTTSDSDAFSSEEEEADEQKMESVAVVCSSDGSEEKMIRRHRGKRKRSEKLVQERVISPITVDNRLAAREERRLAKERAQQEARKERWQACVSTVGSSSKDQENLDDDSPNEDDDSLLKLVKKHKPSEAKSHRYKSKARAATALADTSDHARKIKDSFRSRMATFIVSVLNPYRKSDCKEGRIDSTEDFKYLARKLTHFVMVKELKQLPSIDDLLCNDSVKNKTREFVRKYMSKYGCIFKRDPNDTKEY